MLPLKAKLLTILLVCCFLKPFAQTSCVPVYVNEYASNGHMEPYTMKALTDGTFIIAGRGTASGMGPFDGMVMHVSAKGAILWSFLIGGAADDAFTGIAALADGSFLLSGSTASYGHPESKGWLVLISGNGNPIWSRQIGSQHAGSDRIKAVLQYSDNDIIGTFNEDDSSVLSNPVIFKIGEDGTMRWCMKFDNGNDDSFTSIAFSGNTIYASGYYSAGTYKKGVITELNASNGTWISARNIYRDDPYDQEIAGLEIYNNMISYGLWLHGIISSYYTFNGLVCVQTNLANTRQLVVYADNNYDASRMTPFRAMDGGFFVLRSSSSNIYQYSNVCKIDRYGILEWGRILNNYSAMANVAVAVTADNGFASAHFYNNYATNNLNQMRMVRMNDAGENGDCQLNPIGLFTDTLGYNEMPFSWSSITPENPDQVVITPVITSNNLTLNNVCFNNLCTDKTPLPPGCNKTYRIEYSGPEAQLFRDAVTTPDGGRIAIGESGSSQDGLAVKTDADGQPVWSKRFEVFFHSMKFIRILRSVDGNYWIFATDYLTLNHEASSYIDLIKIDDSGNIISSMQLDFGNVSGLEGEVADAVTTPDGGFILMVNDDWGSGSIYSYIFRCDASAGLIWKKQITHLNAAPVYKSITCSQDAIFLAYDGYGQEDYPNFGVDRLDLKTGNLMWAKKYTIGNNNNTEMINRIFSNNDTSYTFVNNFTPFGPSNTITNTVMVKIDPQGNNFESLILNGETMKPDNAFFYPYMSPPTITMTTENDFVLCDKADVNGINKLNMVRFDKSGNPSWSRNFESMNNHTPENIHQQGTGFLVIGLVDTLHPGNAAFTNGFLLKVDSSGQIMNNATGDCQQVNRSFSPSQVSTNEIYIGPRQSIDISGSTWNPINITTLDIDVDPTAYCIQKATCGVVGLKQKGNVCSLKDTLVYFLQDAASCDATAAWQYDTLYFHALFSSGDSILLQPVREGLSTLKATVEGNCFLNNQQINTTVSHAASDVSLGPDTLLCAGNLIKLSAGPDFASYLWNNNSTDSTLMISASGSYYVQVTDLCGISAMDTIQVNPADFAFQISGDSVSCNMAPAFLQVSLGYSNYQWSPSTFLSGSGSKVQVTPQVNTEYKVTAQKFPGCTVADSILVNALTSPSIELRADTSLCSGDSVLIQAPVGFSHYIWSTGDTSLSVYVKNKGSYALKAVYSNGCISADTMGILNIYPNPLPGLDKNPVICSGSTRELTTSQPYRNYLWNDGSTGNMIIVSSTGQFWVRVVDQQGCYGTDTVDINSVGVLPVNFLATDTVICQFGKIKLGPNGSFQQYAWNDNSTGSTLNISGPGIYWLEVTDDEGCVGRDSIQVIQKQCMIGVYVPNAFTPDHNGSNEVFRPVIMGNITTIDFQVFNRWGQKVFESRVPGQGWDGNIGGMPSAVDTYVWTCSYSLEGQPPAHEKGTVILIR
jgi:gliding motility-associated-like protein